MPEVDRLVRSELGSGAIPGGLETPERAYWPSCEDYRRPGPPRENGVGILPVTSYPGGVLIPWMACQDFENALEWILADPVERTHLAFFARSDVSISSDWEGSRANLEALARRVGEGRLEFATASETWCRCRGSLLQKQDFDRAERGP